MQKTRKSKLKNSNSRKVAVRDPKARKATEKKPPFLVSNGENASHEKEIRRSISTASTIWIAVGFLTQSGVDLLRKPLEKCARRGATIRFYVGLSMYLTEPDGLRELAQLLPKNNASRLFLCDPPNDW